MGLFMEHPKRRGRPVKAPEDRVRRREVYMTDHEWSVFVAAARQAKGNESKGDARAVSAFLRTMAASLCSQDVQGDG